MMTAMPKGKVRPAIAAPRVDPDMAKDERQSNITLTMLSTYRFRDESEYTHQVFDYRLRWTMQTRHDGMRGQRHADGSARVAVHVWSESHRQWHQVWTEWASVESPYSLDGEAKNRTWNQALSDIAEKVTTILL